MPTIDLSGNTIKATKFDGAPSGVKTEVAALTAESTADGSDAGTTQALANSLKAKYNALLAALQA